MAGAWQSWNSNARALGPGMLVFTPTLECGVLASERGKGEPSPTYYEAGGSV